MAIDNAKTISVRIKNKYDSYENWVASGLVLEAGEIAIAHTTVDVTVDNGVAKHPALLMKVGDGENTFANLPWLSAKAADVAAWAKAANKPTYAATEITGIDAYIAEYVEDQMGISVDTDTQYKVVKVDDYNYKLQSKGKTDEAWADVADSAIVIPNDTAAIEALQELVGEDSVAEQIAAAITALDLANTYDVHGAAAAAQAAAEAHADGLNTAMNTRVEALEAIDHDHDNKSVLDGITAEKVAAWDAAEKNAKDHADGLNTAMDERVADLEAMFGDGEGTVEAQIEAAVAAEAKARDDADKALQALIESNDADILALQGLVGDDKVSDLIAAEKERAEAAEKANADAIKAISDDYLKAADKEALQTQINTIMSNPDAEGAINSINEFTAYVTEHGTIADGMRADINKNKDDIAAEAQRAAGVESGLDTRLQAVEAAVGAEGSVADAIDAALTEAKGYTDAEVKELADGAVAGNAAAIEALQTKVGDSSVQDQINAALKVDGVEKYALATALAATDAEVAKKANDADLAAIAKSGSTDDLVQGDLVLVFDCGTSAV